MARSNVEIFRSVLDHLNENGELEWGLYAPDVVWTTRSDGPGGSVTYRGLEGLALGMASFREVWVQMRGELEKVAVHGEAVVGTVRWSVRGRSGVELRWSRYGSARFRDGKIVRIEQHPAEEDVLRAVQIADGRR